MKRFVLSSLAALSFSLAAQADTFSIDNTHSFANWEIRHVVARTTGTFHDIKGKVVLDMGNIANSAVEATVSLYSLNSSHQRRDLHLLAEEFLNARDYPEMKFVSTAVSPISAERGLMQGQLSLHGVTRPVTLEYQILGIGPDPWGGMRAGFKAQTRINRSDFGITKYANNGPVGNEVDITLLIEGIKLGDDGLPWNAKKAAEEKPKVFAYPTPAQPQVAPLPAVVSPVVAAPAVAPVQPAAPAPAQVVAPVVPQAAPAPAPAPALSTEEKLKQKLLKSLFK